MRPASSYGRGDPSTTHPAILRVEVALDPAFRRVIAMENAWVDEASDWTCRVLVGGLKPRTKYWYRFIDETGGSSRTGRTITAPDQRDKRPVHFAFVSCQNVNEGWQHAYRKMVWEHERAAADKQLGFVLHLGDFIYELVEYPEEVPARYDRTINDIGRVPNARKVQNFHVPTDLTGYRMLYRAHLADPDVQDARARFPFVCIGDNHEFSWQGFQSFVRYDGKVEPAQELKVAANQAWWEYVPGRVRKASGTNLGRFQAPPVKTAPVSKFDENGFGVEANNLAAVNSLISYRTLRFGPHVDLIITDLHSYAMEDPSSRAEAKVFSSPDFPDFFPEEVMQILDAGRNAPGGASPQISWDGREVRNFRASGPPVTLLGAEQKAWLKRELSASKATWKFWAATSGTLDARADPQNLPAGLIRSWPGRGYACWGGGDMSAAYMERGEIYDHVESAKISGFVTLSGDRHSFWAGYASKTLTPASFKPVGVAFITGSVSAVGLQEAVEHSFPKSHPLRPLWIAEGPGRAPTATVNLTLRYGVKTAIEYARSGDMDAARKLANPEVAPHLVFVDMGGHGYSVVSASSERLESQFVCIPRPNRRLAAPDGGPVRYRVTHSVRPWEPGHEPKLEVVSVTGDLGTSA